MKTNKKDSYFDKAKAEMIAKDYNTGTSWQHRLYKQKFYENFEEFLFINEVDIMRDMVEKIENKEDW
ncbi:hypothetical protein [uncultured Anaerococcus sp.]|uniref:hypothetical protein n=1 Tax=uncultured Anaerococcus sp. TaxID=293428 RepID=UPI0025FAB37A|nr:hypothetical protein [uncultured Anaerococcus sp.]